MRFLVDAQLPPALARRLEAWGHVAEHVADVGMAAAPDHRVREYAAGIGAVIVTKDEDFAVWRLLHDGPAAFFRYYFATARSSARQREPRTQLRALKLLLLL